MALESSIKEFGIADIFQLIGLQKKSGVLTVHRNDVYATIRFYKGQIVYADSTKSEESEKIGKLLIGTGKLTNKDLDDALRVQEKTGEKIGHILVSSGIISKEDLKEVLQIQVKDVIFQILRWKDGSYKFDIQDIGYEKEYQIPLQIDFVLMEGTRMLDEWPYIESIIPSDSIVFSQSFKTEETEPLFSALSTNELAVFNLIDGKRDIGEIVDLTQLSEFEVYKILATLQVSGLISQTSSTERTEDTTEHSVREKKILWVAVQIAILSFIVSFVLILIPVSEMLGIDGIVTASNMLRNNLAQKELSYLHRAVGYYRMINGHYPDSIEFLYQEQYLEDRFIADPWGSKFIYKRFNYPEAGYELYSPGADRSAGTEDDIF